jgi:hypothetical protein
MHERFIVARMLTKAGLNEGPYVVQGGCGAMIQTHGDQPCDIKCRTRRNALNGFLLCGQHSKLATIAAYTIRDERCNNV